MTITRDWTSESSSKAPQVVEPLLGDQRPIGRNRIHEASVIGRAQATLSIHRYFLGTARAAVEVDRLVARDPVDPRLEVDLRVRLAQPAQADRSTSWVTSSERPSSRTMPRTYEAIRGR